MRGVRALVLLPLILLLPRSSCASIKPASLLSVVQRGNAARVRALLTEPRAVPFTAVQRLQALCVVLDHAHTSKRDRAAQLGIMEREEVALALLAPLGGSSTPAVAEAVAATAAAATLIARGSCVTGEYTATVLYYAVLRMLPRLTEALLAAGADPLLPLPVGQSGSLLTMALRDTSAPVPCLNALLLHSGDIGVGSGGGEGSGGGGRAGAGSTAGRYAKELLAQQDEDGATALFYACLLDASSAEEQRATKVPLVARMLAAGADPTLSNKRVNTPLSEAVQTNCSACVRLLLDAGVDCDPHNRDMNGQMLGATPLAEAALLGLLEIAEILLDAGADANAVSAQVLLQQLLLPPTPPGRLTNPQPVLGDGMGLACPYRGTRRSTG